MFGNVDPRIDKFDKVEIAMMKDLDAWVSNLYFEIEKHFWLAKCFDKILFKTGHSPAQANVNQLASQLACGPLKLPLTRIMKLLHRA